MKLFKCWVEASETTDETHKQQLDYIREGNVGEGSLQGQDPPSDEAVPKKEAKNKETAATVKTKTTEQLAKTAFRQQTS